MHSPKRVNSALRCCRRLLTFMSRTKRLLVRIQCGRDAGKRDRLQRSRTPVAFFSVRPVHGRGPQGDLLRAHAPRRVESRILKAEAVDVMKILGAGQEGPLADS